MQTELLKVSGMNCGGCIDNVRYALGAIAGVGDVGVSLAAVAHCAGLPGASRLPEDAGD